MPSMKRTRIQNQNRWVNRRSSISKISANIHLNRCDGEWEAMDGEGGASSKDCSPRKGMRRWWRVEAGRGEAPTRSPPSVAWVPARPNIQCPRASVGWPSVEMPPSLCFLNLWTTGLRIFILLATLYYFSSFGFPHAQHSTRVYPQKRFSSFLLRYFSRFWAAFHLSTPLRLAKGQVWSRSSISLLLCYFS